MHSTNCRYIFTTQEYAQENSFLYRLSNFAEKYQNHEFPVFEVEISGNYCLVEKTFKLKKENIKIIENIVGKIFFLFFYIISKYNHRYVESHRVKNVKRKDDFEKILYTASYPLINSALKLIFEHKDWLSTYITVSKDTCSLLNGFLNCYTQEENLDPFGNLIFKMDTVSDIKNVLSIMEDQVDNIFCFIDKLKIITRYSLVCGKEKNVICIIEYLLLEKNSNKFNKIPALILKCFESVEEHEIHRFLYDRTDHKKWKSTFQSSCYPIFKRWFLEDMHVEWENTDIFTYSKRFHYVYGLQEIFLDKSIPSTKKIIAFDMGVCILQSAIKDLKKEGSYENKKFHPVNSDSLWVFFKYCLKDAEDTEQTYIIKKAIEISEDASERDYFFANFFLSCFDNSTPHPTVLQNTDTLLNFFKTVFSCPIPSNKLESIIRIIDENNMLDPVLDAYSIDDTSLKRFFCFMKSVLIYLYKKPYSSEKIFSLVTKYDKQIVKHYDADCKYYIASYIHYGCKEAKDPETLGYFLARAAKYCSRTTQYSSLPNCVLHAKHDLLRESLSTCSHYLKEDKALYDQVTKQVESRLASRDYGSDASLGGQDGSGANLLHPGNIPHLGGQFTKTQRV